MSEEPSTDDALLELADFVLRDAGYSVSEGETDGREPLLFIENADGVAAVAAFISVADLLAAEGAVSRELSKRIAAATISAKQWDGYVVLLTSSRMDPQLAEEVRLLTQNLRHVRRIVRIGVDPTRAGLERALRALLPLSTTSGADWIADPLDALADLLQRDGFSPQEVQSVTEGFRLTRTEPYDDDYWQEIRGAP